LDLGRFFSFLTFTQPVSLLGRGISPSQGRYLHAEQHKHIINAQISMAQVGFEPTIPVFERAKRVHALYRAATVISNPLNYTLHISHIESESESLYDWRFTSNQFVLAPSPLRLTARILFSQLNTCDHSPYTRIASSLMRGWVCHLQLLLAVAAAFILGSESLGTSNHILLSQIRHFLFYRHLRLAGLRWRYSTPPPRGIH
jgi:hypothetical protein